jgi:hypothetical protein
MSILPRLTWASIAITFVAGSMVAAPAAGAVLDRQSYEGDDEAFFTACDGVNVHQAFHWSGTFTIRQHGTDSPAYLLDNWQTFETNTNLDTGRSWTAANNYLHADVKIDLVEGTIYRFTWQDAGTFKVFDESGKPAYTQAGLFRTSALVDTKGNTDLSDDEFLEELDFTNVGHYPGGDFCQDLTDFTTG